MKGHTRPIPHSLSAMSKRSVTEVQTTSNDANKYAKVDEAGVRRDAPIDTSEMGEFEDAWEDEIESDEEVVEGKEGEEGVHGAYRAFMRYQMLLCRHGGRR